MHFSHVKQQTKQKASKVKSKKVKPTQLCDNIKIKRQNINEKTI